MSLSLHRQLWSMGSQGLGMGREVVVWCHVMSHIWHMSLWITYARAPGVTWRLRVHKNSSVTCLLNCVERFRTVTRGEMSCVRALCAWRDLQINDSSHRADLMLSHSSSDHTDWHLWWCFSILGTQVTLKPHPGWKGPWHHVDQSASKKIINQWRGNQELSPGDQA